jgi:DNA-binding MarR family transcriptional regulator
MVRPYGRKARLDRPALLGADSASDLGPRSIDHVPGQPAHEFAAREQPNLLERTVRSSALVMHAAGSGVLSQRVRHELGEIGLNLLDTMILYVALRNDLVRMELLSSAVGRPRTTIAHAVVRLERLGYLQRRRNAFDRRRFDLTLTTVGRDAARIADAFLVDLEHEVEDAAVALDRAMAMDYSKELRSLPVGIPMGGD